MNTQKLLAVFVYFSLLCFLFPSYQFLHTAEAQFNEPFKTYENPKFGLTLTYPPTWSFDELRNDPATPTENSIVAIFKSPSQGQNDNYLENVIINVQGPYFEIFSLENFTQDTIRAFNEMPTISITGSQNDTLSGYPAHKLNYTSTGIPGLMLTKTQVFTVINNTAYVVTSGAEQTQYNNGIEDVGNLIDSIKISPDNPAIKGELKHIPSDHSAVGGVLKQIPSVATDFPNNDASVLKVDVFSAKKDTIDNWHIKGQITNTGTQTLEFVNVVAHFYNSGQTVGVTTCCYAEPHTIEPGHTSTFDSFVAAEDMASDPDSFRLSFNWG